MAKFSSISLTEWKRIFGIRLSTSVEFVTLYFRVLSFDCSILSNTNDNGSRVKTPTRTGLAVASFNLHEASCLPLNSLDGHNFPEYRRLKRSGLCQE